MASGILAASSVRYTANIIIFIDLYLSVVLD